MSEEVKIEGNIDINQALKEFEEKSATDTSYKAVKFYNETETPKIVQLTMKWTGFKEQKQAEYVLLGFVVISIIFSLFIFFRSGPKTEEPPLTPLIEQAGSPSDFLP